MGKIKKILENELIGGTAATDVYPVTSVKAVYDENNERLDNLLKRLGAVNISTNYNEDHIVEVLTLESAISKVPNLDRTLGYIGTFLTEEGWRIYQFVGDSLTEWSDTTKWINIISSDTLSQEIGYSEDIAMSQKASSLELVRRANTSWFKKLGDVYPQLNEVSMSALQAVKDIWFSFPNGKPTNWDGYCRIAVVKKPQADDPSNTIYLLVTFDSMSIYFIRVRKSDGLIPLSPKGITRLNFNVTSFDKEFEISLVIDFNEASTITQNIDLQVNIVEDSLYNIPVVENEFGDSPDRTLSQDFNTSELLKRPNTSWFKKLGDVYPTLTESSIKALSAIKDIWFTFPNGKPTNWDGYVRVAAVLQPSEEDSDTTRYFLVTFNSSSTAYVAVTKEDNLIKKSGITRLQLSTSYFDALIILNAIVDFSQASATKQSIDLRVNIYEDSIFNRSAGTENLYPFKSGVVESEIGDLIRNTIIAMDLTGVVKREGMKYGIVNFIVTQQRFMLNIKYTPTGVLPNATTEVYWELTGDWGFGEDKVLFLRNNYTATGKGVAYLMINLGSIKEEISLSSPNVLYSEVQDELFSILNPQIQIELLKTSGNNPTQLFLPPVFYMTKGIRQGLYFDSIMVAPETRTEPPNALLKTRGLTYNRRYAYNTYSSAGDRSIGVDILDGNSGNIISSISSIARVMDNKNPDMLKYILCLGDSTTDDNFEVTKTLQEGLAACSGTTPEFIGTHGKAPWHHEARTGKTFDYYVNGIKAYKFTVQGLSNATDDLTPLWWYYVGSDRDNGYILVNQEIDVDSDGNGYVIAEVWRQPSTPITEGWTGTLQKGGYGGGPATITVTNTEIIQGYSIMKNNNGTGTLDFGYYMNKFNKGKTCDVLCVDLGINDIRECNFSTYKQGTEQIIANARQLFDNFLEYNPNGKIVLCIPKSCASDSIPTQAYTHDEYRIAMQYLRNKYVEIFHDNEFAPNIFICPSGICYDRWYGYSRESVEVAPEYEDTMEQVIDSIHLNSNGYKQVGHAMVGAVLAALNA